MGRDLAPLPQRNDHQGPEQTELQVEAGAGHFASPGFAIRLAASRTALRMADGRFKPHAKVSAPKAATSFSPSVRKMRGFVVGMARV